MEKFLFITHDNVNPYFNIASEEYLLTKKKESFIYLWINSPAVIVGTNQNTMQEVNLSYTEEKGIKTVRRLTGGGAVYHDLNNVCYTVIAPYNGEENTYKRFTSPVIEYLNSLGVKAEFAGRNDILVDGKKISGNAQTVKGGRIMHHGTLLFNTDMSVLEGALKPNKLKIESKGIKSVRARVTNILDVLPKKISVEEFKKGLADYFKKSCEEYSFTEEDLSNINKLVEEKYSTYEWNIGKSPKGKNRFDGRFDFGTITMTFDTENGVISNAEIFGDFFSKKDIKEFAKKLNGVKFTLEDLTKAFLGIDEYVAGANGKDIANKVFS